MAAQQGREMLIKIDMNGAGQFETVAGLRATRISFNAETVDITNLDSTNGWRELLIGAGVRSAAISGSGVFKDASTDERMRDIFFNPQDLNYQMIIPDFGVVEGPFQLTSLELAGTHNGEVTYDMAFASAGVMDFTAL